VTTPPPRALALPGDEQERCRAQPSVASYLYALGRLRATRGQLREGLDTLLECGHAARAWNVPNPALNHSWQSEAALLAARLGERDHAAELTAKVALRAAALIEGGKRGLEQLTEAVAVLDGSGINLELARTLTEHGAALRRAGGRPRRERLAGAEALTASELRVAQLAAQGLTNRQIAQALFVSIKTVSTHLGHVYAKLDVTDRARLAAALPAKQTRAA
jgi:DNA-binding CsgD family transcriptional regulator